MEDKHLKAIRGTMHIPPLTIEQSEEVKHGQASCECYEKFCNSHKLCSFKLSSGSQKAKQSCSQESKQRPTQDSDEDSRRESDTNVQHQIEKHRTGAGMLLFEDDNEV